jgi:hypothetical protein
MLACAVSASESTGMCIRVLTTTYVSLVDLASSSRADVPAITVGIENLEMKLLAGTC